MNCPRCGYPLRETENLCWTCGAYVQQAAQPGKRKSVLDMRRICPTSGATCTTIPSIPPATASTLATAAGSAALSTTDAVDPRVVYTAISPTVPITRASIFGSTSLSAAPADTNPFLWSSLILG